MHTIIFFIRNFMFGICMRQHLSKIGYTYKKNIMHI